MEEELNIAAILKKKPLDTKLWTDMFGEVTLDYVSKNGNGFNVKHHKGVLDKFLPNGKFYEEGTLCIYPSRNMRDWSKFAWKKGDVLINGCGFQCIFKDWASDDYTKFNGCYSNSRDGYEDVPNADTMKFEKAENYIAYGYIREIEKKLGGKLNLCTLEIEHPKQQEFKDGDIVFVEGTKGRKDYIEIFSHFNDGAIYDYVVYDIEDKILDCSGKYPIGEYEYQSIRLAADPEKQLLFDALAKEGKKWNPDTLQLEDLPKKCEFNALDYVLLKRNGRAWELFQYARETREYYIMTNDIWVQKSSIEIVPYDESTKHLLGTTN